MCMIDDTDYAVLLNERTRTARKEHQCCECRRVISKGETYRHEVTLFDGEVKTHKTCRHCLVVRGWLDKVCGGWVYGRVYDDFLEHAVWSRPIDTVGARVLLSMKKGWKEQNGQLMPVPHREENWITAYDYRIIKVEECHDHRRNIQEAAEARCRANEGASRPILHGE